MHRSPWSQNLTAEAAEAEGVRRVEKDDCFGRRTSFGAPRPQPAPAAWSGRANWG